MNGQGLKTRQNLVNIDHARAARRRFLSREEREERGLPGPAIAVALLAAMTIATTAFLYYGGSLVLWGLLWISEVLR